MADKYDKILKEYFNGNLQRKLKSVAMMKDIGMMPDDVAERAERVEQVVNVMDYLAGEKLPERYIEFLRLRYAEDVTWFGCSQIMGYSSTTFQRWRKRIKKLMAEQLPHTNID